MKQTLLLFLLIITTHLFSQNKNQSIGFKENKGQIIDQKGKNNSAVKYLLNSNGLNVQLKKNGFSYDIYEVKKTPIVRSASTKKIPLLIPEKESEEKPEFNLEYTFHRIDIDFVNSNSKVELITEQKSKDFDNYYNVPNKPEGITGVYQYKQVTYKNIYPNIDVVFTIPDDPKKVVEYNFVIRPKGKISDIQLRFNGAETDLVDNKIQMNVRFGKMEETLPASWIEDGNSKKEIPVGYRKIKKDLYGFNSVNSVDGKTIVIDPVPTRLWGTFYGDSNFVHFTDVDSDSNGNSYLSGNVSGPASIYASSGAHQTTYNNSSFYGTDGIIAKFDSNGQRLWGTYYGGIENDKINGLVVDKENNIIITGESYSSTNIATVGSFKPNKSPHPNSTGENPDAFLVKFNSAGVRIWGTYFGGIEDDSAYDVDVDSNNNIYIVGKTNSRTEISFNSNLQPLLNREIISIPDSPDGFLAKFNSNGNIIWSTYAGGENDDSFTSIKVAQNYLVISGNTRSLNHISTPGVFQENKYQTNISSPEGTIYKLTLNGVRLWSTYFSGELGAQINSIEVDNEDNVYIGGYTYSGNNIATPGSFDDYNESWHDTGFIVKFGNDGKRVWGTYIGYSTEIHFLKFKNNHLYVTGRGGYDTSITTPCAYRRNASNEGYLGKFSKNCELIFGTYTGGFDRVNEFNKICFDNNNDIIMGGDAEQNNGIADSNSYQPLINGQSNFYLIKFKETTATGLPDLESNSPVCIGKTLNLKASGGTNYSWTGPNGFVSTNQNPTITNVTTANSGEYSCLITGTGGCDGTKKITVVIGDIEKPIPDLANLPTINGDCHTVITTIPTATDVCAGTITATTISPLSYTLPGTYTIVWNYNDGNGNISTQNQTVTITSQPLPTITSPQTFCMQQNATLDNISTTGQNIQWYDALTVGTPLSKTTILQNSKTYYASQTINGCESLRIPVLINIQNTPLPIADTNQPFCSGSNPIIADIVVTGDLIKWYDSSTNGSLLTTTDHLEDGKTYYASQTINSCESTRLAIIVSVGDTPIAPVQLDSRSYCKNENATLNNIQVSGQNLKWYSSNMAASILPNNTLLVNNTTYYVSQTTGCESERTAILVQVYDTPLPTGSRTQQFCIDEIATLENINLNGTAIKWYDSATNGNILPETTLLQSNTYYASQTLNNCESERLALTIKIQDTQIPIADSPQVFCIQKNVSINDLDITGQNIKWFESASSTIALSESTPLENGKTYYATQTVNNCESDKIPVTINMLEATHKDCINLVDELPFPKFFTPNDDGYNDAWSINFDYLAPNSSIKIYDRYGKLLKQLSKNTSWNGTYSGQDLPASDYWFTVTRANGTEFRGHFSLKR